MSNITPKTWGLWIDQLENILHDADVGQAHEFALHVDEAILAAHKARGTERNNPQHDFLPNSKSKT